MWPTNTAPLAIAANEASGNAQSRAWENCNLSPRGDQVLFFLAWLLQPAVIDAVMPTRPPLARAMARAATGNRPVMELGGGTGPITGALVESGVESTHLTVIERNPVFRRLLTDRFPSLRIICGDAEGLNNILTRAEAGQVSAVVFSLQRVGWPLACQRWNLAQCLAALRGNEVYSSGYSPRAATAVDDGHVADTRIALLI